jgi:hypothetical protein
LKKPFFFYENDKLNDPISVQSINLVLQKIVMRGVQRKADQKMHPKMKKKEIVLKEAKQGNGVVHGAKGLLETLC